MLDLRPNGPLQRWVPFRPMSALLQSPAGSQDRRMPGHSSKDEVAGISGKNQRVVNPRRVTVSTVLQKDKGKQRPTTRQKGSHEANRDPKEGETGVATKMANRVEFPLKVGPQTMEDIGKRSLSEGLHEEKKNKPVLFLPTSDRAAEDRKMLSRIIGVVADMIGGFKGHLGSVHLV